MKTTVLGFQSAEVSPAILGVGDELWVAWADASAPRKLRVTHGHALTQDAFHEAPSVVVATGVDPAVGIAVLNDTFYVAWSAAGVGIRIASSRDGRSWSAPVTDAAAHAAGGVSLTEHDGSLYVAYRDGAGFAALTSWDPRPGGVFAPVTPLGIATRSVPALASVNDPLAWPALHVAVATNTGAIVASRCFRNAVGDLVPRFKEVPGLRGDAVTLAPLTVHHDEPGLAVGVISQKRSAISTATLIGNPPFFAVERSDPLGEQGVDLPRMTTVDDELFLGYRDRAGQIVVACYIHSCRLDPHDARINQECDPNVCAPDSRLVCALQPEHSIKWTPATIENALKGDLVLLPADGNGVIGTLLGALTPRQTYDHMGIMVEDKRVIRHCTESKDRLKDKRYYTGVLVVDPAPTNGLRSDHITYGWPGIIQQTIEDGFYTGLRGSYNADWSPESVGVLPDAGDPRFLTMSPAERKAMFPLQWESQKFYDPEESFTGEPFRYEIQNLPSNPALLKSDLAAVDELLWPIVVRPPEAVANSFPWVRSLLHRIADASLTLRAHYRFYSYTRSAIAIDGSKDPPPKGAPYWSTIRQPVTVEDTPPPPSPSDPSDPGGGPGIPAPTHHTEFVPIGGVDWAVGTHPMVCSTFVWAAVRAAEQGLGRKIVVEGVDEPLNNAGTASRPSGSRDGLYRYTTKERQDSAVALHAALKRQVFESLEEQASGVLGLAAEFFALTSGIADHVATQNVNAFAVDRADEVNAQLWETPGEGDAVGPDDILLQWDAPSEVNGDQFRGLYGDHARAMLVQGAYSWSQDCKYQLADGMAHVRVIVGFTDPMTGRSILVPALVTVGCESGPTSLHARFSTVTGAARTRIKANAWDPDLGVWLTYDAAHDLQEGINTLMLPLSAPPLWRRRVIWTGETRIYHNPDIGPKQQRTEPFAAATILAWDPDVMNNHPAPGIAEAMTHVLIDGGSVHFDDHFVTYAFDVNVQWNGIIAYTGECCFFVDGDKQDDQTRRFSGEILLDAQETFTYEVTHDAALDSHDYGRVVLTIRNEWAKY